MTTEELDAITFIVGDTSNKQAVDDIRYEYKYGQNILTIEKNL